MNKFIFPDGRQFVMLSSTTGQWRDINGAHVSYATVERVEYQPTLGEQYLHQRGIAR